MTQKDKENNPKIEDKDYGFPFVEVTPIQASVVSDRKEKIENVAESIVGSEETNPTIPEHPKPAADTIKFKSEKKVSRKAKSQLPLLLSLVFLIVIILGSIAYFLYYIPKSDSSLETTSPIVTEELMAEEPMSDGNVEVDPEMKVLEDAVNNHETSSEPPAIDPVPEVVPAEIIVVDRRGEIPYYNVIIASSPNERIARTEAKKITDKGKTAWIIFPFGNTNSYRISVGRYEDLESATKAMEIARVELNESSWILKY